jgi:hypothetical protein
VCIVSCTTPYNYTTNDFESVIVIEATITNQLKKQEIKLSKTYKFEEVGPVFETGAKISISDDSGNIYGFDEKIDSYVSAAEFKALPERTYQLHIKTKDGKSYSSSIEKLTTETNIEDVVPTVTTKDGIVGVDIRAKSFDPANTSKYYRYEYDETYQVIAPRWVYQEAIAELFPSPAPKPGQITLKQRTTEARTCYSTKQSDNIILTSTSKLSEDRVDFGVRFIASTDYTIANRYSINVKQYVQNLSAFTFYQTLKDLSGNESLLSQNQPGFFAGNIKSDDDANEKVIGFFDVSAYSEKRVFFNFSDFFPSEPYPKYPYNCPEITALNEKEFSLNYCFAPGTSCRGETLLGILASRSGVYYGGYPKLGIVPDDGSISLQTYPIACGDCTSFSSNIKPLFWID